MKPLRLAGAAPLALAAEAKAQLLHAWRGYERHAWGHDELQGRVLALLSFPLAALIVLANLLSVVWFDAFYAFGIGFLLPEMLLRRLAGIS